MRHDPFSDMGRFLEEGGGYAAGPRGSWRPRVDIYETPEAVVVVMEVAGVRAADIEIGVEGRSLNVTGLRVPAARDDVRRIHHLEIPHGRFHLAIELPHPVNTEAAAAASRDGLLEIVLPRLQPVHPAISAGTGGAS